MDTIFYLVDMHTGQVGGKRNECIYDGEWAADFDSILGGRYTMFSKRLYFIASTCGCQPFSKHLCRHVGAKPDHSFIPNYGKIKGGIVKSFHWYGISNVVWFT
jgi:hypothetical protein